MVQQKIDSKFIDYGLRNDETSVSAHDKQFPVAVKKSVLRDVQNENRVPMSVGNSPLSKDRGQNMDSLMISGTKRPLPEGPVSPLHLQSASSNAANAHLVYVRRKSESEVGKSGACDGRSSDADFQYSRVFARMPVASFMSASEKPSVSLPHVQSSTRFAPAEPNYHPVASAISLLNDPTRRKSLHWEERYDQLQILLKKLDESDQEDYLQMLRSLSSVELSRHAVELEKRAIQLSLEEAKEVQRNGVLNVLGRSAKNFKAPSTPLAEPEK